MFVGFTVLQVWWGESPVVGAKVEASLQRLGVNSTGSRYAPINFLLLDNGSGGRINTLFTFCFMPYLSISLSSGRLLFELQALILYVGHRILDCVGLL